MFLYLIFVFSLANTAVVALQLSILTPLQSQRPLIARLGASYSWNLSSSTFGYENGLTPNVTYDANGLPPWLTFSSNTRSFTGLVPSSWNVGAFPITVTATDDSSRASDSFQFLVSGEPEPQVAIPLAHQINPNNPALSPAFPVNPSSALPPYLSSTTASHGEAGLRVPPTWAFSFGFQGGTFSPWPLFYSATLANGDPLPSWIRYDTSTFTFDGTAPDVDSEEIEILYMASDEDGYSTHAVETFWVVVAAHELKLRDASVGIRRNVSTGCEFEVDLLDGGDADPFVGEVLWDAGPLPRGSIHNLTLVSIEFRSYILCI
jgi:axial budding pattern protein 2